MPDKASEPYLFRDRFFSRGSTLRMKCHCDLVPQSWHGDPSSLLLIAFSGGS